MAAMANGRCRLHGGSTPNGFALPYTKSGRYSKYLPTRLAGRYEEAIADGELLALRDEIGLLDARISQVVSALNTGESREAWAALSSVWFQFSEGWKDLPPDDMERTVEQITELVRNGLSESYVWSEIRGLLKERNDLVASERRRLIEMQQYITAERAMLLVSAVMDAVRRHVSDRDALTAISADIGSLAARTDVGAVPA